MIRWTELLSSYGGDQQAEVELMAHMWRQASLRGDHVMNSNLVINQWNVSGMALQLDYAGVQPDLVTLEWARSKDGYPPPVPFYVNR